MTRLASPVPTEADTAPSARTPGWRVVCLALALLAGVLVAGSANLGAPWLPGDEHIYIVGNPLVNPAADALAPRPLGKRLLTIFSSVQGDLYQPIPIATYALEWELSGGRAGFSRGVDLLLHVVNALLLWWVLGSLLRRTAPTEATTVAWGFALLWALHPLLLTAYAADMGRTHLLAALFTLVAFGWHVRGLTTRRPALLAGAVAILLPAMLCKPVVGWVLVVVTLEAALLGWPRVWRSWRVYAVAAMCVAFAGLTWRTSSASGILADASAGVFGDPITRSAWAVWVYARNVLAPLWLAYVYLPNPATSWQNPRIWVGLAIVAATVAHAVWAWRRGTAMAAVGWAWWWGLLLPVVGLVGAREIAAADRYLYQPLMGILLVVAVFVARWLAANTAARKPLLLTVMGVLAIAMLAADLPLAALARSDLQRARRLVRLNPGDPRSAEALVAALDFARNHPLPAADAAQVPPGESAFAYFHGREREALAALAALPDAKRFFTSDADLAAFRRRVSYRMLGAAMPEEALEQAELARALQPNDFNTWKRIAHANQMLKRFDAAAAAYAECERHLPNDPLTRATHYTDYGALLLFDMERGPEACPKFAAALETRRAPPLAKLGLGICEIRYGQGELGFRIVTEVLEADPGNVQAGLALAEYHLRSHHWKAAATVYAALLEDNPTEYAALRGYHEVCLQTSDYHGAAVAWHDAALKSPGRPEFTSYLVWAMALAGENGADTNADRLLKSDPDNRFACLAKMLLAVRTGDPVGAVEWIGRARAGRPIPQARAFLRAEATVRILVGRGELDAQAATIGLALRLLGDFPPQEQAAAAAALRTTVASSAGESWRAAARKSLALAGVPESLPASGPAAREQN